ncbi:hypothetical protein H5410_054073 [Solanum commersonii]|uniref:Endonuclease/exonuclease/phosphatase domain-containing protein n=1 Tax=Solanum commersonii TaxID=4109 RepID=A0A9J5X855_SOLCO|nr:hypothetical protein H5410_054073 [Solanum commersonii]
MLNVIVQPRYGYFGMMIGHGGALERLELWEEMEELAGNIQIPWLVGGDFNVILNEEEK